MLVVTEQSEEVANLLFGYSPTKMLGSDVGLSFETTLELPTFEESFCEDFEIEDWEALTLTLDSQLQYGSEVQGTATVCPCCAIPWHSLTDTDIFLNISQSVQSDTHETFDLLAENSCNESSFCEKYSLCACSASSSRDNAELRSPTTVGNCIYSATESVLTPGKAAVHGPQVRRKDGNENYAFADMAATDNNRVLERSPLLNGFKGRITEGVTSGMAVGHSPRFGSEDENKEDYAFEDMVAIERNKDVESSAMSNVLMGITEELLPSTAVQFQRQNIRTVPANERKRWLCPKAGKAKLKVKPKQQLLDGWLAKHR
eukprot:c30239_g1_i1 orf=22-969(+)